jgi:hypothetical protein
MVAQSAPPDPIAGFLGPTSKGEGRRGQGRVGSQAKREGREGVGQGDRRGGRGREGPSSFGKGPPMS